MKKIILNLKNYKKLSIVIILSFLPGVVTLFLVHFLLKSKFSNFTLSANCNDQIGYWLESISFKAVGFNHGFFGVNDTSKFSNMSPGEHGPFYMMLFGGFDFIFNTPFLSGPVLNILLLALSFIFFVYYTKISVKRSAFVMAGILSLWFVLLHIPTHMEESVQHALIIALAAIFYRFFFDFKNNIKFVKSEYILSIIFITILSLLRPTYCYLIIVPTFFFFIRFKKHNILSAVSVAIAYTMIFIIYLFKCFEYYPSKLSFILQSMQSNPRHGLKLLFINFHTNFINYIDCSWSSLLEVYQHYLSIIFIIFILGILISNIIKYKKSKDKMLFADICRLCFHIYSIVIIIGINVIFYDVYNGGFCDYRVIAPFLLLSIVIEMAFMQYQFIKQILAANLALVFVFLQVYTASMSSKFPIEPQAPAINFSQYMKYEKASTRWDNTLMVSSELYNSDLVTLPEGFGTSFIVSPEFSKDIRSKYLYLTQKDYKYIPANELPELKIIYTKNGNTLYLNTKRK